MLRQTHKRMPEDGKENALDSILSEISVTCRNCGLCREQCDFLKRFGTPKEMVDNFHPADSKAGTVSFACNLCRLCTAVCPFGVDPAYLFWQMRCAAAADNTFDFSKHKRVLRYEMLGNSPLFSWYGFPEGCDTVFFPGCALPGTRPQQTLALFNSLRQAFPKLGIAFDCCTKPSHDLGRMHHFNNAFKELKKQLLSSGIKTVIVACPSCYTVFKNYGSPLHLLTAYEVLDKRGASVTLNHHPTAAIHDPCATRFDTTIHSAVRRLVKKSGVQLMETPRSREMTLCCGEGGAVGCQSPDLSRNTTKTAGHQAKGVPLVTYCAGCTDLLSGVTPTTHIVDLLCPPDPALPFKSKVYRSPMTYFNRLRLKWYMRRKLRAKNSGTRPYLPRHFR